MENENKLKLSLIECDREKEELEMKGTVLEREKAEQSQTIRYTEDLILQKKSYFDLLVNVFNLLTSSFSVLQPAKRGAEADQVFGC